MWEIAAAIFTREAQTCEDLGYDFVLRVAQDRDVEMPEDHVPEDLDEHHLKTLMRALPASAARFITIPAHHQPKREVFLQMAFQPVRVQPPVHGACLRQTEITAWAVRVS